MNDVFDNVNSGTVNEGEVNDLIDQLQQHDQLRVGMKWSMRVVRIL